MKIEYKDFIGIYQDVYPAGYCNHVITDFERMADTGAGRNRQQSENASKHDKDDLHIFLDVKSHPMCPFVQTVDGIKTIKNVDDVFFEGLQHCFDQYTSKYSILKKFPLNAYSVKIQRTSPGGGYHIFHCERNKGSMDNRVLVYMLYLNSLKTGDGGETEFLYQKTRIETKENCVIIWPADFTHTHRGNLVIGDDYKYVITGWFFYD